jgi:hypothetical protein
MLIIILRLSNCVFGLALSRAMSVWSNVSDSYLCGSSVTYRSYVAGYQQSFTLRSFFIHVPLHAFADPRVTRTLGAESIWRCCRVHTSCSGYLGVHGSKVVHCTERYDFR